MATACAPPLPMERTPDARQAAQKAAEAESGVWVMVGSGLVVAVVGFFEGVFGSACVDGHLTVYVYNGSKVAVSI